MSDGHVVISPGCIMLIFYGCQIMSNHLYALSASFGEKATHSAVEYNSIIRFLFQFLFSILKRRIYCNVATGALLVWVLLLLCL